MDLILSDFDQVIILIQPDPIRSNLICFDPLWTNWTNLDQLDPTWSDLIQFEPISRSDLNQVIQVGYKKE